MKKSRRQSWRLSHNRRPSQRNGAEHHPAAPPAVVEPTRPKLHLGLLLLLCLVGSAAVSFVVFTYFIVSIPRELVGNWEVTAGTLRGATLEFHRDGTAIATRDARGQKVVTNSSARVEGQTMFLTTRDEKTGKEETVTQTIVELTADELVLRDEDQITYHMRRVRN